jgi:predicted nucleic acid-binding protein
VTAVFCDTSVLIRYFAEDDVPRALAAARLIDGESELQVSTGVILETIHVLRGDFGFANPRLADVLMRFLGKPNVRLVDADKAGVIGALAWSQNSSARRVADAVLARAAAQAGADYVATFDERLRSPDVQVRML